MSNIPKGETHYAWKGDRARSTTKRERTQAMYPLQPCEVCGDKKTERHHRDADTGNNAPENIAFVCRRHHMEMDGRLEALKAAGAASIERRRIVALRACGNCGAPRKYLTKGRCHACYEYRRRRGAERPDSFPPPTHCPKGHAYDEENTYVSPKGASYCRACSREKAREYRKAKRRAQ